MTRLNNEILDVSKIRMVGLVLMFLLSACTKQGAGALEGIVKEEKTNQPIANSTVEIWAPKNSNYYRFAAASTDAAGHYEFKGIYFHDGRLFFKARGYVQKECSENEAKELSMVPLGGIKAQLKATSSLPLTASLAVTNNSFSIDNQRKYHWLNTSRDTTFFIRVAGNSHSNNLSWVLNFQINGQDSLGKQLDTLVYCPDKDSISIAINK